MSGKQGPVSDRFLFLQQNLIFPEVEFLVFLWYNIRIESGYGCSCIAHLRSVMAGLEGLSFRKN